MGNARAKYDEIKETMAPAFPEGERSVTEQWHSAGSYQNSPEVGAGAREWPSGGWVVGRQAGSQAGRSVGDWPTPSRSAASHWCMPRAAQVH